MRFNTWGAVFGCGAWAAMVGGGCESPSAAPDIPSVAEQCAGRPQPVDVSHPTTVVGDGTPASCTEQALIRAVEIGGVITFDCGADPTEIVLQDELVVRKDTVIDGAARITVSGDYSTRIFHLASRPELDTPSLTLQNLHLVGGAAGLGRSGAAEGQKIAGGAVYREGGRLAVFQSLLQTHTGPSSAPSSMGGAIYAEGVGETVLVDVGILGGAANSGGALATNGGPLRVYGGGIIGSLALGSGGVPGDGGVGGGVLLAGDGDALFCGVQFRDNIAAAHGGGLFRIADRAQRVSLYQAEMHGNYVPEHTSAVGRGGAIFVQGGTLVLDSSTVSSNGAAVAAGIYAGAGTSLWMVNDTLSGNVASVGSGGGMQIEENPAGAAVRGQVTNCSFVFNVAYSELGTGGAIAGGGDSVVLKNNLFGPNYVGNGYNPVQCTRKLGRGGPNLQAPSAWQDGTQDAQRAPCADDLLIADPQVLPLDRGGGPTQTHGIPRTSPAVRQGTDCPRTDQRGVRRPLGTCSLGAYEAEQ